MALRKIKLTVDGIPIGQALTFSYPASDGNIYTVPTYKLSVRGNSSSGGAISEDFEVLRFGYYRPTPTSAMSVAGLADQQTHIIKAWLPTYNPHSFASKENGAWQVYASFLIHDGPDNPKSSLSASIGCIEVCGPGRFLDFNDLVISLSGSIASTRDQKLAQIGSSGIMSITYMAAKRPPVP